MKIKRFFESLQNNRSLIDDAFVEIEDTHKIKILEITPSKYQIEIQIENNNNTKPNDHGAKIDDLHTLVTNIKTSLYRLNLEDHSIYSENGNFRIHVVFEDDVDYKNMIFIKDNLLECDQSKIIRFLKHQQFDSPEILFTDEDGDVYEEPPKSTYGIEIGALSRYGKLMTMRDAKLIETMIDTENIDLQFETMEPSKDQRITGYMHIIHIRITMK